MEHNEMINKLHNQAGISREDAEDALKRADWDMLDALRILEQDGKIAPLTSSMTTVENTKQYDEVKRTAAKTRRDGSSFESFAERIRELIFYGIRNSFIVRRRDSVILNLPVIVMALIVIFAFRISIVLLLLGLFFECHYSIERNKNFDNE